MKNKRLNEIVEIIKDDRLSVTFESKLSIFENEGTQPVLFCSSKGTLAVPAQVSPPPDYVKPGKNIFPVYPGINISRDGGITWIRWYPTKEQGMGPATEGVNTTHYTGARKIKFEMK